MAMNLTRYGRKIMLDHLLGRSAYSFPSNVYLGCFIADPTDVGTLDDEVSVSGYARIDIASAMAAADAPSRQIALGSDIEFAAFGEAIAAITHFGVLDAATLGTGNVIWSGELTTPRAVGVGETFPIKAGQFTASLSNQITRYAAKAWLDHVFGGISFTQPTPYLGLLSAAPSAVGSMADELSGGSYARVAIASLMGDTVLASGQATNASAIQFPDPTADWSGVEGFFVADASSGGNMLLYGQPLAARRIYSGGQPFLVEPNRLVFYAQ